MRWLREMYTKGLAAAHHCTLMWGDPPPKRLNTITDAILLNDGICDPRHKLDDGDAGFKICLFPPSIRDERRLVTKIQLLYAHSDCKQTLRFTLHAGDKKLGRIVVPAGYAGPIAPETGARIVYEPRFVHLNKLPIMHYVGMEDRIMSQTRTWIGTAGVASEYRAFDATDPLLVFMLQHRHLFDELSADDMRISQQLNGMYMVRETLVQRVQKFFGDQVLPLIEYLPLNCEHLTLLKEDVQETGSCMLQLQLDYVSVFDAALGFSVKTTAVTF
jgi:hypothetical protein